MHLHGTYPRPGRGPPSEPGAFSRQLLRGRVEIYRAACGVPLRVPAVPVRKGARYRAVISGVAVHHGGTEPASIEVPCPLSCAQKNGHAEQTPTNRGTSLMDLTISSFSGHETFAFRFGWLPKGV